MYFQNVSTYLYKGTFNLKLLVYYEKKFNPFFMQKFMYKNIILESTRNVQKVYRPLNILSLTPIFYNYYSKILFFCWFQRQTRNYLTTRVRYSIQIVCPVKTLNLQVCSSELYLNKPIKFVPSNTYNMLSIYNFPFMLSSSISQV